MVIWGDYNSHYAQQIDIKFVMCKGGAECKDEKEIQDWLKGKYIVLLYN